MDLACQAEALLPLAEVVCERIVQTLKRESKPSHARAHQSPPPTVSGLLQAAVLHRVGHAVRLDILRRQRLASGSEAPRAWRRSGRAFELRTHRPTHQSTNAPHLVAIQAPTSWQTKVGGTDTDTKTEKAWPARLCASPKDRVSQTAAAASKAAGKICTVLHFGGRRVKLQMGLQDFRTSCPKSGRGGGQG